MAQQGSLFRLVNNIVSYRSILGNSPRFTIAGHQQRAGIKQELKDRLKDLNLPEKPKRPLTPYFRFMTDQRPNLLKKFPNIKVVELTKKVAEEWTSASLTLKEEYTRLYKAEMETFNKVFSDYNMQLSPLQKDTLAEFSKKKLEDKKRRLARKLNKAEERPKRPIGPYMQYLLETSKREGLKMNEVLTSMKGKWNMLSDSEKERYKMMYEEDKKRYEAEMEVWEKKMMNEGKLSLVRRTTQLAYKPSRLKTDKIKKE